MDVNGDNQINVTNNSASDSYPSWSPDGRKLVFNSSRDESTWWEIYAMDADGESVIRLTNNMTFDGYPSWSP